MFSDLQCFVTPMEQAKYQWQTKVQCISKEQLSNLMAHPTSVVFLYHFTPSFVGT